MGESGVERECGVIHTPLTPSPSHSNAPLSCSCPLINTNNYIRIAISKIRISSIVVVRKVLFVFIVAGFFVGHVII